ncbi:MAG TPA: cupin domain-containing protein [Pseudorhodoplanes sp.]|jgi:mannose-6-phosphate isomerase-like protein (cupin superfamily)|nr:cupin domain-containing protein [Pseudorhodoplanes sp.]
MKDDDSHRLHRPAKDYRWEGVARMPYKEEGSAPFKAISRQILHSDPRLAGELRYFEMDAGGYSTLERHEHVHGVMILRGRGQCLLGDRIYDIGPHDLVSIPPWTWHQFRANRNEPLGFLCLVNVRRDKPQLPSADELRAMKENGAVAAFLES